MKQNQCDIFHLQEANIDEERFSSCDFIKSSYIILENNSLNKYGTASLVKSDLEINDIKHDMEGRVLLFDVGDITVGNIYLPSGTDGISRAKREKQAGAELCQAQGKLRHVGLKSYLYFL